MNPMEPTKIMTPTEPRNPLPNEPHEACLLLSNGSWDYGLNGRMVGMVMG